MAFNFKDIDKDKRLMFTAEDLIAVERPLYGTIMAGYPAEAYNYIEDRIDLNKKIIRNKSGNCCMWVTNRELIAPGIKEGDLLVFDTKITPAPKAVCLYYIDDEYSLRWIEKTKNGIKLVCPNPEVSTIVLHEGEVVERKATLTHRLKKFANYRKDYGQYKVDIENYIENGMDYNKYFLGKEEYWETIFYLNVEGESMTEDGIVKKDLLVVDRFAEQYKDSILAFLIENRFTLKRVVKRTDYTELVASNPNFPIIRVPNYVRLEPWGVLTGTITDYLKNYEALYSLRPE